MYTILLLLCILVVVLSPLALDVWLTAKETRALRREALLRRRATAYGNAKGPRLVWASPRMQ